MRDQSTSTTTGQRDRHDFPAHQQKPLRRAPDNDDAVLTFSEWCVLNGFSSRTGRRILAGPKSKRPIITWLSERRMGVTRGNNRKWQESRAR
jgi:hypothetical protein